MIFPIFFSGEETMAVAAGEADAAVGLEGSDSERRKRRKAADGTGDVEEEEAEAKGGLARSADPDAKELPPVPEEEEASPRLVSVRPTTLLFYLFFIKAISLVLRVVDRRRHGFSTASLFTQKRTNYDKYKREMLPPALALKCLESFY